MCGIAGLHRRNGRPIPKLGTLADALLVEIEPRGRDATGFLTMMPSGKVQMQREVVPARTFIRSRKAMRKTARTVLLHTRWATVGDARDVRNAHPVVNGTCAAVHNGTIYNHAALFRAFGIKRNAAVDSEVIPAMIAYAGWDQAAEAIDLFEGGAAFAVVSNEHPDEVILARTESFPLVVYATPDFVVWASTRHAIEAAWRKAFGRKPEGGEWITVPEWTMLRINGTIEVTTIRKPKPTKPKKVRVGPMKVYAPTARQRRKRGSRRKSMADAVAAEVEHPPAHIEREPWMEEEVRDLMRIYGMDYAQAFDAVYGVEPPDDEYAWVEDLLAEGKWS